MDIPEQIESIRISCDIDYASAAEDKIDQLLQEIVMRLHKARRLLTDGSSLYALKQINGLIAEIGGDKKGVDK